ncbi:MAG TPA: hypothetical protein VG497_09860, partial [Kribbella sp.]|nr:hypothetical protein [Kribbella sp.]
MTTFEIRSPDGRTTRTASLRGPGTATERAAGEPGVLRYDVALGWPANGLVACGPANGLVGGDPV